jgi:hypothetical protein
MDQLQATISRDAESCDLKNKEIITAGVQAKI